jgi:hypothetical protein
MRRRNACEFGVEIQLRFKNSEGFQVQLRRSDGELKVAKLGREVRERQSKIGEKR